MHLNILVQGRNYGSIYLLGVSTMIGPDKVYGLQTLAARMICLECLNEQFQYFMSLVRNLGKRKCDRKNMNILNIRKEKNSRYRRKRLGPFL